MSNSSSFGIPLLPVAVLVLVVLVVSGTSLTRKFLGVSRSAAAGIFLLAVVVSMAVTFYLLSPMLSREWSQSSFPRRDVGPIWVVVAGSILPLFAVPFLAKLYHRWIGGHVTDAEKAPGMEGIRVWLGGGNLICAVLIALCAAIGFGCSFWGILALTLMALVAYPLLNAATESPQPAERPPNDGLSAERERVLKMLDDGKITAEESAELLTALGQTAKPPRMEPSPAVNPHRKMAMIGLGLLVIGFFLPWFSFNPGNELARTFPGLHSQMSQMPNGPANLITTVSVHVSGGDIAHGLGWVVLLLGIAVAVLPYIATNLDAQTQRKAMLAGLGVGGLILVYLLTQNIRFVSIGILLGLAGYTLEFLGTLKERGPALR